MKEKLEQLKKYNLELVKRHKKPLAFISTGAAAGAWTGTSIGIAALGGAISGLLPCAAIGGYVGYRGYEYLKNKTSLRKKSEQ
jgi:hypothetical protein